MIGSCCRGVAGLIFLSMHHPDIFLRVTLLQYLLPVTRSFLIKQLVKLYLRVLCHFLELLITNIELPIIGLSRGQVNGCARWYLLARQHCFVIMHLAFFGAWTVMTALGEGLRFSDGLLLKLCTNWTICHWLCYPLWCLVGTTCLATIIRHRR